MSNTDNEVPANPTEEIVEETELPRAKTPLEMVREGQAKMRGQKPAKGRISSEGDGAGPADSYKRRLHQRKSG